MANPKDYLQPEFFRFGWDSLFLVEEVLARTKFQSRAFRLLELGAGSGVVSCEVSQRLVPSELDLVEAQEEWRPYLLGNLQQHGHFAQPASIHWTTVGRFNPAGALKYDLILSNPPYFHPDRGRPSPNAQRNAAHRLILDDWATWLSCFHRSLAMGGEAWWLQKDPGPQLGAFPIEAGFELKHEVRSGPMRLLCLRRLNVE